MIFLVAFTDILSRFDDASRTLKNRVTRDDLRNLVDGQQSRVQGHLREFLRALPKLRSRRKLSTNLLEQCHDWDGIILVSPGLEPNDREVIRCPLVKLSFE